MRKLRNKCFFFSGRGRRSAECSDSQWKYFINLSWCGPISIYSRVGMQSCSCILNLCRFFRKKPLAWMLLLLSLGTTFIISITYASIHRPPHTRLWLQNPTQTRKKLSLCAFHTTFLSIKIVCYTARWNIGRKFISSPLTIVSCVPLFLISLKPPSMGRKWAKEIYVFHGCDAVFVFLVVFLIYSQEERKKRCLLVTSPPFQLRWW